MYLLVVLDPVPPLLLHLLHDLVALVLEHLRLDHLPRSLEVIHVLHARLPSLLLRFLHPLDRVPQLLLSGHRPTSHAQEKELLQAEAL